jgi:DNA-binding LacI/PurR family transcriptional regulator
MTLVLLIADTEREQANAERYVRAGHVDGVLLVSSHESDDLLGSLVNAGVPTVCSGIPLSDRAVAHVAIDEVGAARTMTRHLMDGGHRRIALITGPLDTPSGRSASTAFATNSATASTRTSSKRCLQR